MTDIEQKFADLLAAINTQQAEHRANASALFASDQRLKAALKAEETAQASLQQATADLKKAEKELAAARSAADKLKAEAKAEAQRIVAEAQDEAATIIEEAEQAADEAANLMRRRKSAA
jgi:cell division septum initiation protein DivIVA